MTSAASNARILLVRRAERPDRAARPPAVVRRYRLARVRIDDRRPGDDRHAHLRRSYD